MFNFVPEPLLIWRDTPESYSKPSRTSKTEAFAIIVKSFQSFVNYFHKKLRLKCSTGYWIRLSTALKSRCLVIITMSTLSLKFVSNVTIHKRLLISRIPWTQDFVTSSYFDFQNDELKMTLFSTNTGKYGAEITPYLDTFHAVGVTLIFQRQFVLPLYEKWSFPLRISSINITKSFGNRGFSNIYWRNSKWKTSFFVQCAMILSSVLVNLVFCAAVA